MEVTDTSTNEIIVESSDEFYMLEEFKWWEEEGATEADYQSSSSVGEIEVYTNYLEFSH